jgi:hypothetical protein
MVRPAAVLAVLVAAATLAGCASRSPGAGPAAAAAALSGWSLDCGIGASAQVQDAAWPQACEARASKGPGPKQETWLAINPTDPRNVVIGAKDVDPAYSSKCVWNGVFVTHDSGLAWTDVHIGGTYAERQADPTSPFYGYDCNTDPMFQFTADGALHYGVEIYHFLGTDYNTPTHDLLGQPGLLGWKILLATSHDGGLTWPDVITYQPDLLHPTDYSRMAVSPTTQSILEAIGSTSGGCHLLASRDGGKTADLFRVPATSKGEIPCQAIAASPTGTVVLAGGSLGVGEAASGVVFARSTDDGRTFLDSGVGFDFKPIAQFTESKARVGSGLELAYDLTSGPGKGTLYALYAAADRDEADLFVRSSHDDGKTWSDAVRVNQDDAGPHQWNGNLAVAGDGSVHAVFMDKRYDPKHTFIDIVHAVSTDGGATWSEERATTRSFDGDLGRHQSGDPFIGDYIGVAALGPDVWAGIPDSSEGKETAIAAMHSHKA